MNSDFSSNRRFSVIIFQTQHYKFNYPFSLFFLITNFTKISYEDKRVIIYFKYEGDLNLMALSVRRSGISFISFFPFFLVSFSFLYSRLFLYFQNFF